MAAPVKLVVFDLENTLIFNEFRPELATIVGKEAEVAAITRAGIDGRMDWEMGFRARAERLRGLTQAQVLRAARQLRPVPGAKEFVDWLHARASKVVLITGGPREVAESALELFEADAAFSNEFHYEDGVFTGSVTVRVSPQSKGAIVRGLATKWKIEKDEIDAVGVYEVLAKAKQIHPKLDLTVRFRAMKEQITGALGMKFLAHEVHHELSDLDLVIVPGGAGRKEVVQDTEFLKRLLDFGTEKPIASVCTGALILSAAGLLAGRKATTHQSARDELGAVADVVDARVVEDGLVTTAGGVTASIDLGLHLLEKHFGPELAREVEERIEYQ